MNKNDFLNKLTNNTQNVTNAYNYANLPSSFLATDKIPITCTTHGVFYQQAHVHLAGAGCAKCARDKLSMAQALPTTEFIKRAKNKFGEKYSYEKTKYCGKNKNVTVTCHIHGDFNILPNVYLNSKHGCNECLGDLRRHNKREALIQLAKKVHGDKYDYSESIYVNPLTNVKITCPMHGEFWQNLYSHANKQCECPKCAAVNNRLSTEDFITRSKLIHGDVYSYDKVVYVSHSGPVTIKCNEHGDFIQRASSHLSGNGCRKCHIAKYKLSTEQFIAHAKKIHGNRYDYSKVRYDGNKKPVEIVCSIHGSFWQRPNSHVSKHAGCIYCLESKGENMVKSILDKYGVPYIREYRILPYLYRYDFYLPTLNIFIEFNGKQHYMPIDYFGGIEAYHKTKTNDLIKKKLINDNNGSLIIATYTHLNDNAIEKYLINCLKRICKYWFVINGKLCAFKTSGDVYKYFNIPLHIRHSEIITLLENTVIDFKVLF